MKTTVKRPLFLLLFSFLLATNQTSFAQTKQLAHHLPLPAPPQNAVKPAVNTSVLHENHVGQITFTTKDIPTEALQESDLLTTYHFTNRSELFMAAFMEKPLAQHLLALSPSKPAAALAEIGSYQFDFFVDGKHVFLCGLPPNNIDTDLKYTQILVKEPFIARPRQRRWGESIWNLFLRNGGQQALTDGNHILKMEIRPVLHGPEPKVGNIIAEGQLAMNVNLDPKIDISTISINAIKPYSGLPVSGEKYDVNKIKELKGKTEAYVFKDITSIVVLKNGKILLEEYFNNADRNTLHDVRSVGKSFASTVAGIAIKEGYLKNENQELSEFYNLKNFATYSPQKEHTTIKDLLTMSSVFEGNDDKQESAGNEEKMYPTQDWVKFALEVPADTVGPVGEWHYFTAGAVLLGDIIHKKVPGGLEKYSAEKLFKPLGIEKFKWQYTPQKVVNTAGGIRMNALDFAKYGQLYKNGGKWNGQRILSKAWVAKTFTQHKAIPGRAGEHYGYLFWNKKYHVQGQDYETFYCAGNGGNKIFVFKDQPLVVVVTATAYGTPYGHAQVDKIMTNYILPAVINK